MWLIETLTPSWTRSSGSESRPHTNLAGVAADGELLANAVGVSEWKSRFVQAIVCGCGIEGCADGGWVAPRRCGELVLLLPDFDRLAEDEGDPPRHGPPSYVGRRGIPVIRGEAMERAADALPSWPRPRDLAPLMNADIPRILQWEAPWQLLGRYPEPPQVRCEDILAASEGLPNEQASRIDALLLSYAESGAEAAFRPIDNGDRAITLYVDAPSPGEWCPLVVAESDLRLVLCPGIVIV